MRASGANQRETTAVPFRNVTIWRSKIGNAIAHPIIVLVNPETIIMIAAATERSRSHGRISTSR